MALESIMCLLILQFKTCANMFASVTNKCTFVQTLILFVTVLTSLFNHENKIAQETLPYDKTVFASRNKSTFWCVIEFASSVLTRL